MGPTAVEEKVWSRNRTVTSVMAELLEDGLITYVQWHICHLVGKAFHVYSGDIASK
jgi:hypothetical protein